MSGPPDSDIPPPDDAPPMASEPAPAPPRDMGPPPEQGPPMDGAPPMDMGPPPEAFGPPRGRGGPMATATHDGLSLPHALEAEREVLASVLVDPRSMDTVQEHLDAEDFYLDRHGLIYEAMKRLNEAGGTIDLVTLQQDLKDHGQWDKSGGVATIGELLDRAGSTAHLEHYCLIVHAKGMIRRMISAARTIEVDGFGDIADPTEYLDRAEQAVFAVLEQKQNTALRPIGDVVKEAIDKIAEAFDAEGSVTGIGTGYREFDKLTHGLQGGDLIIVAARPAMGKTSFCLNLAANAALRHGASVAIFSLEMPNDQLATRMLAAEARIDMSRLRGGFLTEDDWPKLTRAADDLSQAKIFMDDTPGLTPSSIRAKCRRLKRKSGLDLVIIDYLQLMSGGDKNKSREQEISYISRSLKGLAKELHAPIIALSQLNRSLESRTDKRPMMSDLRESGAIEQDADMIGFIYREEVYNQEIEESKRGVAELIIGKHRNGPTGTVYLKFWKAWTRFDNLAPEAHPHA